MLQLPCLLYVTSYYVYNSTCSKNLNPLKCIDINNFFLLLFKNDCDINTPFLIGYKRYFLSYNYY